MSLSNDCRQHNCIYYICLKAYSAISMFNRQRSILSNNLNLNQVYFFIFINFFYEPDFLLSFLVNFCEKCRAGDVQRMIEQMLLMKYQISKVILVISKILAMMSTAAELLAHWSSVQHLRVRFPFRVWEFVVVRNPI